MKVSQLFLVIMKTTTLHYYPGWLGGKQVVETGTIVKAGGVVESPPVSHIVPAGWGRMVGTSVTDILARGGVQSFLSLGDME